VIGVVCTSYPRSSDESAGSFVRTRVRALRQAGHGIEVLAAGDDGEITEDGVRVARLPGTGSARLFYQGGAPEALTDPSVRGAAWLEALFFSARLTAEVARRAAGWDAVESHWLLPSTLAVCAAAPGLRHRAHAHGGDVFLLERVSLGASMARFICRAGVDLVFVSQELRQRFAALCGAAPETWGARTCIEPAPVDTTVFRRVDTAERRAARARLGVHGAMVMAAGRLVPIKGFDVLVLALASLPLPVRPHLVIAGTGPECERLQRLARACAVDLHLPGDVSHADLATWMLAADVFVHPCRSLPDGRREGAPLVVREALALGISVIASAQGGIPDLAGQPGLTLVQADRSATLASEIRDALSRLHAKATD
jgi:glycosyltransferase involved in cell wall biosynthesis